MTGDDAGLLVVASSVAGQLEDLSGEVLHDGSQVHGGTSTDTLSIVSLAEETMDTSHGELESSTVGARLALSLDLASLATTRHVVSLRWKNAKNTKKRADIGELPSLLSFIPPIRVSRRAKNSLSLPRRLGPLTIHLGGV
jgi:hypothetical protein